MVIGMAGSGELADHAEVPGRTKRVQSPPDKNDPCNQLAGRTAFRSAMEVR